MKIKIILSALLLMPLLGCQPLANVPNRDAIGRAGSPIHWDTAEYDKWSGADVFHYQGWCLWDSLVAPVGVVDSLRVRNPGQIIIGYVNSPSIFEWHERGAPGSWARRWWDDLLPYLAYTTEGDTARPSNAAYCINMMDPAVPRLMADIVCDFYESSPNQGSGRNIGIMLDVVSRTAGNWSNGPWREQMHGLHDYDQDGVPQAHDADEKEACRQNFHLLIDLIRERLGPRFLITANGELPYTDDTLAAKLDGQHMEGFPRWHFGGGKYWQNALTPGGEFSLAGMVKRYRTDAGGPVVTLDAAGASGYGHITAHLVDGCYGLYRPGLGGMSYLRPLKWAMGAPLEPATARGDTISRRFEGGIVRLVVGSGVGSQPFESVTPGILEATSYRRQ